MGQPDLISLGHEATHGLGERFGYWILLGFAAFGGLIMAKKKIKKFWKEWFK